MKLTFNREQSTVEVETTQGYIPSLSNKVMKAIAPDLPEAHWNPAIATQEEIRQVVENIFICANTIDE